MSQFRITFRRQIIQECDLLVEAMDEQSARGIGTARLARLQETAHMFKVSTPFPWRETMDEYSMMEIKEISDAQDSGK